jgi:hypothetical protein
MRRLGSGAGCGVPRMRLASASREASGHRPGPLRGSAAIVRLDVDSDKAGKARRKLSRKNGPEVLNPAVARPQAPRPASPLRRRCGSRPNHYNRACRRAAPLMSGGENCSHLGRHGRRENGSGRLFDIRIENCARAGGRNGDRGTGRRKTLRVSSREQVRRNSFAGFPIFRYPHLLVEEVLT